LEVVCQKYAENGEIQHKTLENYQNKGTIIKSATLDSFISWEKSVSYEVETTESFVKCDKYKFAGTIDMLGKIMGKKAIGDFKTSKAVNVTHKMQICAYRLAKYYEEGFWREPFVLAINPLHEEYYVFTKEEIRYYTEMFLHLCSLFHLLVKVGELK